MKTNNHIEKFRLRTTDILQHYGSFGDEYNGVFVLQFENRGLFCIQSRGEGWEHVSISTDNRCPNWKEMCFIKNTFWEPEEAVMQLHPPESEYVSCHPYCLHLWRPIDQSIPLPPFNHVGPTVTGPA